MVFTADDVISRVEGLSSDSLYLCIEEGWITPTLRRGTAYFAEIDIVRLELIQNMQMDLEINAEAIPVILSLIDQIHGLRHKLHSLADAVRAQSDDVQQAVLDTLRQEASRTE